MVNNYRLKQGKRLIPVFGGKTETSSFLGWIMQLHGCGFIPAEEHAFIPFIHKSSGQGSKSESLATKPLPLILLNQVEAARFFARSVSHIAVDEVLTRLKMTVQTLNHVNSSNFKERNLSLPL